MNTPSIRVLDADSNNTEMWARRCRLFRKKMALFQLSSSPDVKLPPPYLFTMRAMTCPTVNMLPPIVHWSPALYPNTPAPRHASDCFDPEEHQSLDFLYSSWVEGTHTPCVESQVVTLYHYGRNDLTLGYYVENLCLNADHRCSNAECDQPVERHIRSFAHGEARVLVGAERLKDPIPNPNFGELPHVFMWSWCKECNAVTPVIPMSEETWHVSLAKYLELTFFAADYRVGGDLCPHSYHHRHVRYFGKDSLTMYFEYQPINLLEVTLSPRVIHVPPMGSYPSQWYGQIRDFEEQLTSIHEEAQRCVRESDAMLHVVAPTASQAQSPGIMHGAQQIQALAQKISDDMKMLHGMLTELASFFKAALQQAVQRTRLGAQADSQRVAYSPSLEEEAAEESRSSIRDARAAPRSWTTSPSPAVVVDTGMSSLDTAGHAVKAEGFTTVQQPLLTFVVTRELDKMSFQLRHEMAVTTRDWNVAIGEIFSHIYAQKKLKKSSGTSAAATSVGSQGVAREGTAGDQRRSLSPKAFLPVPDRASAGTDSDAVHSGLASREPASRLTSPLARAMTGTGLPQDDSISLRMEDAEESTEPTRSSSATSGIPGESGCTSQEERGSPVAMVCTFCDTRLWRGGAL